jgi:hypothetical protein
MQGPVYDFVLKYCTMNPQGKEVSGANRCAVPKEMQS